MTNYMNCGYCTSRHPVEEMGEHGREKCAHSTKTTDAAGQWLLEAWQRIVEGEVYWQDMVEGVAEDLFPHQYGELMAKDEPFTPDDETTMMRSEDAAERRMIVNFLARLMFVRGITTDEVSRQMEANE